MQEMKTDLFDYKLPPELIAQHPAERRDMDAFRSYLDADARFISARVLRGRDEIADAWQVFFEEDGPEITWRPQFVEVLDDGKLALSRGPYRVVAKDEDDANSAIVLQPANHSTRLSPSYPPHSP